MTPEKEAARGVISTRTAEGKLRAAIIASKETCDTLRARLALVGATIQCARRAADGRQTFHVTSSRGTHVFSHMGDLLTHVEALEYGGPSLLRGGSAV